VSTSCLYTAFRIAGGLDMRSDRSCGRATPRLFADGDAGANQRGDRSGRPFLSAVLALSIVMISDSAIAQGETAKSLAERSAIVVLGKVLKTNASDEPMVAASSRTAVILVRQMYAGGEI